MRINSLIKMSTFDNVVLDIICKKISDPSSYFNFSILSKKCHRIAMLHRETKANQFTKLVMVSILPGYNQKHILPDGTLHGIRVIINICHYYYFGIKAAIYYYGHEIDIYRCECTEDLKTEWLFKKLYVYNFLEGDVYIIHKCDKCGHIIVKYEYYHPDYIPE